MREDDILAMKEKENMYDVNEENILAMKEVLGQIKRVSEGSVIRFVSGGRYTYAAVYVGGKWWLTGTGKWYGGNVFDYEEFFTDVLACATDIQVATDWSTVR